MNPVLIWGKRAISFLGFFPKKTFTPFPYDFFPSSQVFLGGKLHFGRLVLFLYRARGAISGRVFFFLPFFFFLPPSQRLFSFFWVVSKPNPPAVAFFFWFRPFVGRGLAASFFSFPSSPNKLQLTIPKGGVRCSPPPFFGPPPRGRKKTARLLPLLLVSPFPFTVGGKGGACLHPLPFSTFSFQNPIFFLAGKRQLLTLFFYSPPPPFPPS